MYTYINIVIVMLFKYRIIYNYLMKFNEISVYFIFILYIIINENNWLLIMGENNVNILFMVFRWNNMLSKFVFLFMQRNVFGIIFYLIKGGWNGRKNGIYISLILNVIYKW